MYLHGTCFLCIFVCIFLCHRYLFKLGCYCIETKVNIRYCSKVVTVFSELSGTQSGFERGSILGFLMDTSFLFADFF